MDREEIKDLVLSENNYLEEESTVFVLKKELQEVVDILKVSGCNTKKLAINRLEKILATI